MSVLLLLFSNRQTVQKESTCPLLHSITMIERRRRKNHVSLTRLESHWSRYLARAGCALYLSITLSLKKNICIGTNIILYYFIKFISTSTLSSGPIDSSAAATLLFFFTRRLCSRSLALCLSLSGKKKMQGTLRTCLTHGNVVKDSLLQHVRVLSPLLRPIVFSRFESVSSARIEEQGFESTRIADILKAKGKGADGSWLWCTTDDTVYDAVKSMTQHNVGALVVVKPGEQKSIAGIITERDYLRKIIVQGRSSKSTKVGDIMTEENKLITVTPDTKVLKAMQLMTDKRIRHIPVIDDKDMIGMVSIGDVVRAVVSEHREELDRLNAYIQGGY